MLSVSSFRKWPEDISAHMLGILIVVNACCDALRKEKNGIVAEVEAEAEPRTFDGDIMYALEIHMCWQLVVRVKIWMKYLPVHDRLTIALCKSK